MNIKKIIEIFWVTFPKMCWKGISSKYGIEDIIIK